MSFYGSDFKLLFTNTINGINLMPFPLTGDMYTLNHPTVRVMDGAATQPTDADADTTATLIATGAETTRGDSYYGQVNITYNRLDLAALFMGIPVIWESSTATSTQDFALWANTNLGLPLNSSDLVAREIGQADHNTYVTLTADPDSPYVVGECQVWYTRGKPDISTLIPTGWQSGAYPALTPLDSYRALTYHRDYTGAGNILRLATPGISAADRTRVWGAVMGNIPSQYLTGTDGQIVTGESNIVAAGGRPGFQSLFIMPILNVWAHFND